MPLDRAVNVAEFLANQFEVLNSPSPQPQSRCGPRFEGINEDTPTF